MKKLLFTLSLVFTTLFVSAQIMVVTTYDGDQEESMDKLTANMGVGYQLNDKITIGAVKSGEEYELFARYNMDDVYLSLQMPTEESTDNMVIGAGYSFCAYKSLYVEPNYSMPMNEDEEGNREGEFKLGLAYRF